MRKNTQIPLRELALQKLREQVEQGNIEAIRIALDHTKEKEPQKDYLRLILIKREYKPNLDH